MSLTHNCEEDAELLSLILIYIHSTPEKDSCLFCFILFPLLSPPEVYA